MSLFSTDRPFVDDIPSQQNAINLFTEWASLYPQNSGVKTGGGAALFDDQRIHWLDEHLGQLTGTGISGKKVFEMGPLEGGHTHMLARLGASEVLAVEANAMSYVKCLISKEVLPEHASRIRFLLGDAVKHLDHSQETYDLGICCGFLYHVVEPYHVLELLARRCRSLYLWSITHHPSLFEKRPAMMERFGPPLIKTMGAFSFTVHPHYYGDGIDYRKFWGGTQPSSYWMSAEDIIAVVKQVGFTRVITQYEDNPFGLALGLVATQP